MNIADRIEKLGCITAFDYYEIKLHLQIFKVYIRSLALTLILPKSFHRLNWMSK